MHPVSEIIRSRRAVFEGSYTGEEIPATVLDEILENANWAPTHKRTEPWRFIVYTGQARQELSDLVGGAFKKFTPPDAFSEIKWQKIAQKPLQASATIVLLMQRDPKLSLPEWEEQAAVACAVQNMWLTCTAYRIGAYWSSPGFLVNHGQELFDLPNGQSLLGLLYMGTTREGQWPAGERGDWQEKVVFKE
ncbi:MAG: nitroreductase [Saprospiraceae bacterium]|nr:nitroreductase [Saprospiraceae bacterium]